MCTAAFHPYPVVHAGDVHLTVDLKGDVRLRCCGQFSFPVAGIPFLLHLNLGFPLFDIDNGKVIDIAVVFIDGLLDFCLAEIHPGCVVYRTHGSFRHCVGVFRTFVSARQPCDHGDRPFSGCTVIV